MSRAHVRPHDALNTRIQLPLAPPIPHSGDKSHRRTSSPVNTRRHRPPSPGLQARSSPASLDPGNRVSYPSAAERGPIGAVTLAEGIPPSGGNALGVDRLIMLLVGTRQIDDVVTFTSDEL